MKLPGWLMWLLAAFGGLFLFNRFVRPAIGMGGGR